MDDILKENEKLYESLGIYDLRNVAREKGVKSPTTKKRQELIDEILKIDRGEQEPHVKRGRGRPEKPRVFNIEEIARNNQGGGKKMECIILASDSGVNQTAAAGESVSEGILEILPQGYGFLRSDGFDFLRRKEAVVTRNDVFVTTQVIRNYGLRAGDIVKCTFNPARENQSPAIKEVISVNGFSPEEVSKRKLFDNLTPVYPDKKFALEIKGERDNLAIRCVDLLAPIGMGQRGLIVSPPKAGKTTLLKSIAKSIEANYPNTELIVLLIDERPEEVTDFKRSVKSKVIYSNFDETAAHHVKVAELVIAHAKRLAESGVNVVILLDSITRLARAYNSVCEPSGRTLSGGIDPVALYGPKKFFGAARNIETGGSLTIIATALVDTGSRMDDIIYEEFKGTGNMELHLSRELSERRIFPAIDLFASGTRREELLLSRDEMDCAVKIRKFLAKESSAETLLDMMKKTENNAEFIYKFGEWIKIYQKGK